MATNFKSYTVYDVKGKIGFLGSNIIVYGTHINGGYTGLLNKKLASEMGSKDDIFYNQEKLSYLNIGERTSKNIVNFIKNGNLSTIENIRELSFDCNGNNFLLIFGKFLNICFCIIPNWNKSFTFDNFSDIDSNSRKMKKYFNTNKEIAEFLSQMADFN